MSVSSEISIMNSALIKLGCDLIISPDENNSRARTCKLRYPVIRDLLQRSHPWNFCIGYVELASISPTPSDVFDYDYVFQLPSDFLRVLQTNLSTEDEWEEIEGNRIACDVSTLKVKGIKRVADVTKFDSNFCEALAYALAEDMAYLFTQSASLKKQIKEDARDTLRAARSFDAQVGSVRRVQADEWFSQRRY